MTDKRAPYRLHIGIRITKQILWTMLTDLKDEPLMHFRTLSGAMRWLAADEYTSVEFRSGKWAGIITFAHEPITSDTIEYYADHRFRIAEEATRGEDNRPITQLWGEWNYRKDTDLRLLEGNKIRAPESHPSESKDDRADADPRPVRKPV